MAKNGMFCCLNLIVIEINLSNKVKNLRIIFQENKWPHQDPNHQTTIKAQIGLVPIAPNVLQLWHVAVRYSNLS